jgi:enamine deaminase RidA (YjgF/YER057c/UK114 family)
MAMDLKRIGEGARLSKAVVANGFVFVSGQVPNATRGKSVGEQTQEVLDQISAILADAGSDKSRIVNASIWLQDIRTVAEFNAVWDEWVAPGGGPSRACVEARLQAPTIMVEVAVVALAG